MGWGLKIDRPQPRNAMKNTVPLTLSEGRVTFRYLAVPHEETHLGGFALWYESVQDAEADFTHFHLYFTEPPANTRAFKVSFAKDSSTTHTLTIVLASDAMEFNVRIHGVGSEYVTRLRDSLRLFPYYFVTAGYSDIGGESRLLTPHDYTVFLSALTIDGRCVRGKQGRRWPWEAFQVTSPRLVNERPENSIGGQ